MAENNINTQKNRMFNRIVTALPLFSLVFSPWHNLLLTVFLLIIESIY
ncbi:hypothetical protein bcere0021_24550 [Bacillus cereus Rock3-42]|nr:hypothetical protein bcere0021_24550 [Bacillus cereus Rock3-42]